MSAKKFLGVTVLPEYIQTEGVNGVLDRLASAGVNAAATSPYLMEPADASTGSREPPADAGAGGVRLLDRPLWGKRDLYVRTAPAFEPDRRLYRGLRYQPPATDALTRREGHLLQDFIRGAHSRHIRAYMQIQAAIPPGYRVQFGGPAKPDQPLLPDGRVPSRRVDKNGSLASEQILAYGVALTRDLLRQYPDLDGLRYDWPEYPPYLLDDCFLDFNPAAIQTAAKLGIDPDRMRRDTLALYQKLHGGLQNRDLEAWLSEDGGRFALSSAFRDFPGVAGLVALKAQLVQNLLATYRSAITAAAGASKEMLPNAFPPPFTAVSGLAFERIASLSSAISVKLYTMHWPMMLRFYGDALRKANPGLSSQLLARVLVRLFDIADDNGLPTVESYEYPDPDTPHSVGAQAQRRKIQQAQLAAGTTPVYTLVHGYGPIADFRKRLQIGWEASPHGIWINRYAYLTDQKLQAVGEICT